MTETLRVVESIGPPSRDLAFEESMLTDAAAGRMTLSVSSWPGPVVVLGYAQPPDDVDLGWCRGHGVPVLRRLSGGTGVIHRGDLSLALALPREHPWAGSIIGLYDRFLDNLQPALAEVGSEVRRVAEPEHATRVRSPVCFFDQLADTLLVGGKKAVGCSQTRRKDGVLVHAAVLLGLDGFLYTKVFGIPAGQVVEHLAPAVQGVGWEKIAEAVVRRFSRALAADPRRIEGPEPGSEATARYRAGRWAPVPDDGIASPETELV